MQHPHSTVMQAGQRGVVLFFALVALVVMSLAAVALIRSVDTGTIIAGNLAFRQSATASGDGGSELALTWLETTYNANKTIDQGADINHPLNKTNAINGYYSGLRYTKAQLLDENTWTAANSASGGSHIDQKGNVTNTMRYIVERMCRNENQVLSAANCLLSDYVNVDSNSKRVLSAPEAGAKTASSGSLRPPLYRVTVRTTGPKNTVSYVQAFVY